MEKNSMSDTSLSALEIDAKSTALILIDLQNGILSMTLAPHSSKDVVSNVKQIASALRTAGGTIAYVRVDIAQILRHPTDAPIRNAGAPPPPPSASELVPDSGFQPGDLLITKRSWGAFYGTDLDLLLRRNNIKTILIGGVATNYGVESTARAAFDRGYQVIFVEDAMSSVATPVHEFAIQNIFPRMGRVRSTMQVLKALEQ
jgi:nicotinamidase-related amidase